MKNIYAILFTLFLVPLLYAQEPPPMKINQIKVEDGLSQGTVYSILQDSRKFMWFSSYEGLNRYDGHEVKVYRFNPTDSTSLQGSSTIGIVEDKNGDIWVGSEKSLNHYRRQTDDFEPIFAQDESGKIKESINLPFDVDDTHIWYVNNVEGIIKYNFTTKQKQIVTSQFKYKRSTYVNNSTIRTKDGKIWFRLERGIIVIDPEHPENNQWYFSENIKNKLGEPTLIICAFEDAQGVIWLGSRDKIILFYPQSETYETISIGNELGRVVTDIKEDQNGNILIGTEDKGIIFFDKKTKQLQPLQSTFNFPYDQKIYAAATVYTDKEGIIWSNTDPIGINSIVPNFKFFKKFDEKFFEKFDFKSAMIRCFAERTDGKLWIGTYEDGIFLFNPETNEIEKKIVTEKGFDQNHAGTLLLDQNQGLWIGTYNGLYFLENENSEVKKIWNRAYPEKLESSNLFWHIVEAKDGTIIFATDAGIYFLKKGDDKIQILDTLQNIVSGFLFLDEKERVFIPEYFNGFYILDYQDWFQNNSITKREVKHFLPEINVKCFYQKPNENILWVSTNNGLLKIHHQEDWSAIDSIRHYTQVDGLPSNYIYGILEDKEGNLWMSTNRGICKFNPTTEIYNNYSTSSGIQGYEFNSNSFLKATNGEFYFGGTQGFNRFTPSEISKNPNPPLSIELIDFQINGKKATSFGNIGELASLTLQPQQNTFTFKYVAIDYISDGENQYQVLLNGIDEEWQMMGNKNNVRYTKIPPGNYTFQVKAANSDGIWLNEIKTISIKILAPWYQTTLAYLLYISTLGILFYVIYKFRKRRQQLKLELHQKELAAERLQEMDQFKSTFYTNITHEFRTPLTVIQGMSEELRGNIPAKKLIQSNTQKLLQLINQLLDLSKVESGSMPLNLVQSDIINYLNYLIESVHSYAFSKKINLSFYAELEELKMDFDEEKMQSILLNLISNAIKFTPEYGKIMIVGTKIAMEGQPFFKIKISDTGIGISPKMLPFIFDRYFQIKTLDKEGNQGSGIGLALVKELTEMLNGKIEVKSEKARGTTFTLIFPISNQAKMNKLVKPKLSDGFFIDHNNGITKSKIDRVNPVFEKEKDLPHLLVIEDNYDVIQYLNSILNKKYQIVFAKNGAAGIDKALLEIPDIIISDVMMPEKNGFEVCATLKQDERTSHIPIILLTAKATTKDKIEGLQYGADAYLEKPFNKEELFVRLEKLLELRKRLQEHYSNYSFSSTATKSATKEDLFLQKINKIIKEHLNDELFNTPFLCKKIGMSQSQLYRKLKALTGYSIANYIRLCRLQKAHTLLETSDLKINEVAYQCGFSNPSWFTQAFTENFGYSPSELRK